MSKLLWQPSQERIAKSNLSAFTAEVNRKYGLSIENYAELHAFSIRERKKFWLLPLMTLMRS
jgi:acetoacetyl-CoA synthetase